MKLIKVCLVLASLVFFANAEEEEKDNTLNTNWLDTRVSFSMNESKKYAFLHLPKTMHDAYQDGYKPLHPAGSKCSEKGMGYKFVKNNDPAVVPIYGANGFLVGIENGFPESQMKSQKAKDWFKKQHLFEKFHPENDKDETIYALQVYFQDPAKVCDVKKKWVPGLYALNGSNTVHIPKDESKLDTKHWVKGKCIPNIGWRYYYGISKNMKCDYFQPFAPIYIKKTLIGFSSIAFGKFDSPHYNEADEHIPKKDFSKSVEVVPTCLENVPGGVVTTLHVYLID
uniref:Uncharacterized protein n=1 Tax=Strigamia maritima TaxID=126957 RepID=T1IVV3_STRMM